MAFEDILARCLDALERGETIEHCIARYPEHAAELSSLLKLAVAVRSTPQPRLSASAFARAHAAVIAQARLQHAHHAPFHPARGAAVRNLRPQVARSRPIAAKKLLARRRPMAKPLLLLYKAQAVFIACLVVLSLFTFLRTIRSSLPGATLYPVKILGENMEGVLLTAAGEQATWYAQQTENRLQELGQVAQQDPIASAELERTIDQQVLATVTASNQLPAERRNQFLLAWVARLRALDKAKQWPSPVARTLDRTLATIQTATQVTVALPTPSLESIQTDAPTPTPTALQISVPSATPNPVTVEPQLAEQTTPPLVEATIPAAEPVVIHPTTVAPDLAPAMSTVLATATSVSIIVQVPQETTVSDDHQSKQPNKAAVVQPEQTTEPAVAAAVTQASDNHAGNAEGEIHAATSMTTGLAIGAEKASAPDPASKVEAPTATVTPAFSLVDVPTPATGNGPAIAPATALATEETATATPSQTALASTSTPTAEQITSPTRFVTVAATVIALPSSTAATTITPAPTKTATSEPEKTVEPTATLEPTEPPKPTATLKPTDPNFTPTPEQKEATVAPLPTLTPENTPIPKKHK